MITVGKRRYLTENEITEAIRLRETGWTKRRICARLNLSQGGLNYQLLKNGVERPGPPPVSPLFTKPATNRNGELVRYFQPDEDARLIQMALDGLSNSAIGRCLGRSRTSIKGRLMTLARQEERASGTPPSLLRGA